MKEIFLTFDDGPNEYTLRILEILKGFGTKATFFVLGKNCQKFPEILKKIFRPSWGILTPWRKKYPADLIKESILKKIKPNTILLFHDCLQTPLILSKILNELKIEGYNFRKF